MQPSDNDILWLALTNAGLALTTASALGALVWAVARALRERAQQRAAAADPHLVRVPGLGVTLADGGTPNDSAARR